MIRAILFDMDGVVVDSEHLYQEAGTRLFAEYGVTLMEDDWIRLRGQAEHRFYELVRERYPLDAPTKDLQVKGRSYLLDVFADRLDYNQGFLSLIRRIVGRYRTGLVTSTSGEVFRWMDMKLDLRSHFDEVVYGGMTINGKPHPEPYLMIMDHLGIEPAEAVIIEDSAVGLQSALASGACTVALTGPTPTPGLPEVYASVRSLNDLTPSFLKRLDGFTGHREN
ncbi:HAD family hydrolase [Candidatus Neomarinimicrobiota bacterium]